jgi:hypothetical protein
MSLAGLYQRHPTEIEQRRIGVRFGQIGIVVLELNEVVALKVLLDGENHLSAVTALTR